MSLVQVILAEVLDLVDHGLEPLLVGRAVPELPAREVVEVSEGGHPRLRMSHHHYVARLGSVGPDYCNLEYLAILLQLSSEQMWLQYFFLYLYRFRFLLSILSII